jgi:hypothetical protein
MFSKKGYFFMVDVFIAFMIFIVTIVVVMSFSVTTRSTIQEEVSVQDFLNQISKDKVIESTIPVLIDSIINNELPSNDMSIAEFMIYLNDENKDLMIDGILGNVSVNYVPTEYRLKVIINQTFPREKVYQYCDGGCANDNPKIELANYIISANNDYIVEKSHIVGSNNVVLSNVKLMVWHN